MLTKCLTIMLFERLTQLKNAFDPSPFVLECADIRDTGNCHKYYVYDWEIPMLKDGGAEITTPLQHSQAVYTPFPRRRSSSDRRTMRRSRQRSTIHRVSIYGAYAVLLIWILNLLWHFPFRSFRSPTETANQTQSYLPTTLSSLSPIKESLYRNLWSNEKTVEKTRQVSGRKIMFVHMRKAGGTTVGSFLREKFAHCCPGNQCPKPPGTFRSEQIVGWSCPEDAYVEAEYNCFDGRLLDDPTWETWTAVRHPINRIVSMWMYNVGKAFRKDPIRALEDGSELLEWMSRERRQYPSHFWGDVYIPNYYCWVMSCEGKKKAASHLKSVESIQSRFARFDVVLDDRMPLDEWARRLGGEERDELNRNPSKLDYKAHLNASILRILERENACDMEVYEHLVAKRLGNYGSVYLQA